MDVHHRSIRALLAKAPEMRETKVAMDLYRAKVRGPIRLMRSRAVVNFRRAHEAHRDARLVFRAAAGGRPLELQNRLVLGKLAGGISMHKLTREGALVTPLQAATLRGCHECVQVLRESGQHVDTSERVEFDLIKACRD